MKTKLGVVVILLLLASGVLYSQQGSPVGMNQVAFLTTLYTNATTTFSNVGSLGFPVQANRNYKVRCDLDY